MRLLLDTHALLWWLADAPQRPDGAAVIDDFAGHLARERFIELPISVEHARRAGTLALAHRDPFDRMLLAQSLTEGLTLVTADPVFTALPGFAPLW